MINDPITKVMQDASEIIRYDEVGIPLYICLLYTSPSPRDRG